MRERHTHRDPKRPAPKGITDKNQKHDMRDPQNKVDKPGDGRVDARAAKCGEPRKDQCEQAGQHRRDGTDKRRDPQPAHGARKHIAPHPIGSKGMGKGGSQVLDRKVARNRCRRQNDSQHGQGQSNASASKQ